MGVFEGLKPEAVWGYFEEICQVPRPSKKEGKIIAYLLVGRRNTIWRRNGMMQVMC